MKNFLLNQNYDLTIELFSKYHLLLILITFLICALIINNKELFVRMSYKKKKLTRIILAILLIINFVIRRGSFLYFDVYNWRYHLDINFCNFTSIMFIIYGLTGNNKIYNICFYMAFIGPLMAIVFPSVNLAPLNYSFYSFVILHHVVFIFNIMFMYIEKKEYKRSDAIKAIIFLGIYHLIIYIFNIFCGTNYNETLSFVNNSIQNNRLIIALTPYYLVRLTSHIIVEIALFIFANFILKKLIKKSKI